jgi:hypothetical protein
MAMEPFAEPRTTLTWPSIPAFPALLPVFGLRREELGLIAVEVFVTTMALSFPV